MSLMACTAGFGCRIEERIYYRQLHMTESDGEHWSVVMMAGVYYVQSGMCLYFASQVMADECFAGMGNTDARNYQVTDRSMPAPSPLPSDSELVQNGMDQLLCGQCIDAMNFSSWRSDILDKWPDEKYLNGWMSCLTCLVLFRYGPPLGKYSLIHRTWWMRTRAQANPKRCTILSSAILNLLRIFRQAHILKSAAAWTTVI